jgi:hypothetical protein
MIALSPHPFGSTFDGPTFNDNLSKILGHFIALLVNAFRDSIIVINDILYLVGPSFALSVIDVIYCTIYGM